MPIILTSNAPYRGAQKLDNINDYQIEGFARGFSLRAIATNYAGAVVRVRRSTDSVEADFTAAQVTNGQLSTFCNGADGFVPKLYDQSGGAPLAQATPAAQPRLVKAGVVDRVNNVPALIFDGVDDTLTSVVNLPQPLSLLFAGICPPPAGGFAYAFSGGLELLTDAQGRDAFYAGKLLNLGNVEYLGGERFQYGAIINGAGTYVTDITGAGYTGDPGATGIDTLAIAKNGGSNFYALKMHELLLYDQALTQAKLGTIRQNQSRYLAG